MENVCKIFISRFTNKLFKQHVYGNGSVPSFFDLYTFICYFPDAHFYIGRRVTQSADITYATIKRVRVSMKPMQKATAVKMAPTVPLHMDRTTCAVLSMISGTQLLIT